MPSFVKQLIPPFVMDAWKASAAPLYRSYEEAYAACRNGAYEEETLVRVVIEKNLIFQRRIQSNPVLDLVALRTLIGVGLADTGDSFRVLDFGGGGGYHYTLARAALNSSKHLKWNVIETSAMTREAQRIANAELGFFDNMDDARNGLGSVDLVLTSGALQYCADPVKCLKALTEVGAKTIYITRTAFSDSEKSLISVQESKLSENGPGPLPPGFTDKVVRYPITFVSRHVVESILTEKYRIMFSIQEDKDAFRAGNYRFDMRGYFCRKM